MARLLNVSTDVPNISDNPHFIKLLNIFNGVWRRLHFEGSALGQGPAGRNKDRTEVKGSLLRSCS